MAGHGKRHRIRAAGRSHRAHRARLADGAGDVLVAAGFAVRDAAQRLPHAALEYRAADVERNARETRLACDEGKDFFLQLLQRILHQIGLAELLGEQAPQLRGVIAELDRAQSLAGRRGEHCAQRRSEAAKTDRLALAPRAIVARLHAQVRLLVKARYRAVAGVEHRVGNAAAIAQRRLHRLDALRVLVAAWREAERLLEAALQVERARADRLGELVERHALAAARVEIAPCLAKNVSHGANSGANTEFSLSGSCAQPAMVRPPDTLITWPVMKPASSEARNATMPGMSSGWPTRFIGIARTSAS